MKKLNAKIKIEEFFIKVINIYKSLTQKLIKILRKIKKDLGLCTLYIGASN